MFLGSRLSCGGAWSVSQMELPGGTAGASPLLAWFGEIPFLSCTKPSSSSSSISHNPCASTLHVCLPCGTLFPQTPTVTTGNMWLETTQRLFFHSFSQVCAPWSRNLHMLGDLFLFLVLSQWLCLHKANIQVHWSDSSLVI